MKLGSDELTQIEKYAFTVAADEQFRGLNTRWSFWVLSNDLDQYAAHRARASHLPRGVVFQATEPTITIYAKTWSEVLQENKARLRFFQGSWSIPQIGALRFGTCKRRMTPI